jgi:hypothetical protein
VFVDEDLESETEGQQLQQDQQEQFVSSCCSKSCDAIEGSAHLFLPCGHGIHNSCLYVSALRNGGRAIDCPECGDKQLSTILSVIASAKDACTSKDAKGRAYVTATSAPRPGTDLHRIYNQDQRKQVPVAPNPGSTYGLRAPKMTVPQAQAGSAVPAVPQYLFGAGYGKLSGVSAQTKERLAQRSINAAIEQQESLSIGEIHAQRASEATAARARFAVRSGRPRGTPLNGSIPR